MSSCEVKNVCVIGAGITGLIAVKECLDEGLVPTCYERTDYCGGLWNYHDEVTEEQGSVMYTTITNTSKEFMAFSDFPPPKHFSNYMHHTQVMEYFKMYIEKFDLEKHIQYNTVVVDVKRVNDFAQTGQWLVTIRNKEDNELKERVYDAVMVCNGHFGVKHIPKFKGEESFPGRIMHSLDYRRPEGFENKTVLIIGIGNSAADIAADLCYQAKQVHISMKKGTWMASRLGNAGIPVEVVNFRRYRWWMLMNLPRFIVNSVAERLCNVQVNHKFLGIKPKHRFLEQNVLVNDDLGSRILNGTVKVQCNIHHIENDTVYFADGSVVSDVDIIIKATGFHHDFPFLSSDIVDPHNMELFGFVWPPEVSAVQPTLAVIGCISQIGAVNPPVEMQCRWATGVFKKLLKLPSKSAMQKEVQDTRKRLISEASEKPRYANKIFYIDYMNYISSFVGCKPNLFVMLFRDPRLALQCMFGPCVPYQYRLQGPGQWGGAREAIMSLWERVTYPLQTAFSNN